MEKTTKCLLLHISETAKERRPLCPNALRTIILIGEQLTAIGLGGSGCVSATKYLLTSIKVEYEWVGEPEEGSAKGNAMFEHGRWKKV